MRTTGTILVMVLGLLVMPVRFAEAGPMETAFTYQGHLYDANYVADGLYDFAFKLYDANSGGSKIGTDVNVGDVDVIDGYFTVELDFNDANAFNGDARWLEIGVRQGDMNDPNVYTTLSPRQEVTPAPYALYAKNSAGDSDWIMSGGDMYSGVSGNVGIGTASPGKKLDVAGHINAADYYFLNDKVLVYNTPGTGNLFYGWDVGIKKHSMATNGVERLVVDDSGNVGIGTTAPTQMLDVDGKARIAGDVYLEGILNLNDSSNTTYIQNVGDGLKFWVDTLGTPIAFDFQ
jgi:hypothetical protein